ncbi:MAG: TetR/AcrR family transcriptional regulator [Pseudomonadota bacterium]
MRREPVQERSQARIEFLLETAETLILEQGLAALSIREVARLADTNIATFYQFFPSRKALIRRIVEKYQALLQSELQGAIEQGLRAELHDALDRVQSTMFKFYRDNPVTLEIWPGTNSDPELRALDQRDTQENADAFAAVVTQFRPDAAREDARAAALLIVLSAGNILRHAVSLKARQRNKILRMNITATMALIQSL